MLRALMLRALTLLTLALVITLVIAIPAGQAGATEHSPALADTAPAGTVISAVNWRRYARFMPAGMQAIFAGDHFWRMPSDVLIFGPQVVLTAGATIATAPITTATAATPVPGRT